YPLKFEPLFKDKIWGGQKIKTVLNKDFGNLPNCGEMWALSGFPGSESIVSNGFLAGNDLNEVLEVYMDELVGEKIYETYGNVFPLLIKILDASDWLSIQVHPDDDLARQRGLEGGKTEMWYILQADEDSKLISGFNRKINQHVYLQKLKDKELTEILNFEEVKAGDVYYMPAGRVHATGPGILLAEIQQTSDTTYRIFDWDRVDDKGNGRELHLQDAMAAIDFDVPETYKNSYVKKKNETVSLVKSEHFVTNLIDIDVQLEKDFSEVDSFVIYLCIEGAFELDDNKNDKIIIEVGETVLLPASTMQIQLTPLNRAKILEVYILPSDEN
ncbi:MAG: class I mannose-6-phosphate isomerase, partial [Bacteroidales bacterium]|nr:class I mannose-6-phosphate isomerase [Bacteroidales bacterium]